MADRTKSLSRLPCCGSAPSFPPPPPPARLKPPHGDTDCVTSRIRDNNRGARGAKRTGAEQSARLDARGRVGSLGPLPCPRGTRHVRSTVRGSPPFGAEQASSAFPDPC